MLDPAAWQARRAAHQTRVDDLVTGHLARGRLGAEHPVEDFLFTYYRYRPAQLRRWHPGLGVVLAGADPDELGAGYRHTEGGVAVDPVAVLVGRRRAVVTQIRDLLAATAARPAFFGCLGMHEWAMVYGEAQEELRHRAWPLRLGQSGVAAVLAGTPVRCSHFDAYRFFTPAARPLNVLRPTRDTRVDHEQPGCLHANMDVYRFAFTLSPLAPSELVADCFTLARDLRVLDMRASPYDLTGLRLTPVRVETADGRAEYVAAQRELAARAAVLRARLSRICDDVLAGEAWRRG